MKGYCQVNRLKMQNDNSYRLIRLCAPPSLLYHRHRFPAEIISHCVWLYFRFALSFRDVERSFVEVRRRTRPMVTFVNMASVDRIIFAIFSAYNEKWGQTHPRAFYTGGVDITPA